MAAIVEGGISLTTAGVVSYVQGMKDIETATLGPIKILRRAA